MVTTTHNFTPFIPSDLSLQKLNLQDKVIKLTADSAKLAGIPLETRDAISGHMAVINSYYSNLIEGNRTEPHEIREAQKGNFSEDPAKRDLQLESIAHIKVQEWLVKQNYDVDTLFTVETIQSIHREFYTNIPESLRELKNEEGNIVDIVIPGEWRKKQVRVGKHIAPPPEDLLSLMPQFLDVYNPNSYYGDKKVIAIMCAHHRLAWLHPFADGNGRVGRLFTDAAIKAVGIDSVGVWCLSRGLAKSSAQYKNLLERADFPGQGDLDGRGLLSDSGLNNFCNYMLDTAIDQVSYMSSLLQLDKIQERIMSYIQARNDNRINGLGAIKEASGIVLCSAFVNGKLKRPMANELTGMPERTARRLIAQLKEEGLLMETSTRSPLYWGIPDHAESWYFPELAPRV